MLFQDGGTSFAIFHEICFFMQANYLSLSMKMKGGGKKNISVKLKPAVLGSKPFFQEQDGARIVRKRLPFLSKKMTLLCRL